MKNRMTELLGVKYPIVQVPMSEFRHALDLYFGGDMEASIALSGQVAGRIDRVKPVAQVIAETAAEFEACVADLTARDGRESAPA
ncbi:hypothetical protein [Phenylobacterium sp.]|uniref:hypothetical protein n=1 Tax=Phenylobacterium sp. TaxID=1871053 RepID=UPI0039837715